MAKKRLRSKYIGLPRLKRRLLKRRPKTGPTNRFLRLIYHFLPHISRNINAGIKILIAISLILILYTSSFFPVNNPLSSLLSKSTDFKTHLELIKILITNHQYSEAREEVLYTLWLFPQNQELKQKSAEIKSLISKRPELIKELSHWEKIMKDRPNYRDGLYQLAILNYQIMENQKARDYLEKTLALDPNFTQARQLLKKIN